METQYQYMLKLHSVFTVISGSAILVAIHLPHIS